VQEEDDFEDEPIELAPSRIEKALRFPLAALPFGGIVLELLDLAHEQNDSAIAQTVGEIIAGTGAELLTQRIRDDSEVRATVIEALTAAGRTGLEAKRRTLSKLVTAAILDDARVDEAQLLILALRDLEGPHIRALTRAARAQGVDVTSWGESRNKERSSVVTAVDAVLAAEPTAVIATLLRTGAITQDGMIGQYLSGGSALVRIRRPHSCHYCVPINHRGMCPLPRPHRRSGVRVRQRPAAIM